MYDMLSYDYIGVHGLGEMYSMPRIYASDDFDPNLLWLVAWQHMPMHYRPLP